MPVPASVLGLAAGLLGGGSQTTQNTTVTNANNNTFNPNIVFGGDSNFQPSSPVANDFIASASSSQSQEQADPADLLSAFNPVADAGTILGGVAPLIGAATATSVPIGQTASTSAFAPSTGSVDPVTVGLALAAAVVVGVVVFKPNKRGR